MDFDGKAPEEGVEILTPDFVREKARWNVAGKTPPDSAITHLNLWACGLSNVSIISRYFNAQVLSLSDNRITTLKPFRSLLGLRELYLRNNGVSDLAEVAWLRSLRHLRILWLRGNPMMSGRHSSIARQFIVAALPQLTTLDNQRITSEERAAARAAWSDPNIRRVRHRAAAMLREDAREEEEAKDKVGGKEEEGKRVSVKKSKKKEDQVSKGGDEGSGGAEKKSEAKRHRHLLHAPPPGTSPQLRAILTLLPTINSEELLYLATQVTTAIHQQKGKD